MSTMPAFLLGRDLSMSVGERALPSPGRCEAVIRVGWAGLCGSDLHVMRTGDWVAEWPATLGHEIYGTVERAPEGGALAAGDAVIADSRIACGKCTWCRAGERDRCVGVTFVGEARPGGFAALCALPAEMLHSVPPELAGSTAVLAEPLAVVLHALSQLRTAPRHVAILGHGPIGALAHIELRRRYPEATVEVAEPAALRARLARALGATGTTNAADLDDGAFDTVIDAAGYHGSLTHAVKAVAPRGQVLVLALSGAEVPMMPRELVERSIAITGANAFIDELPEAIARLADEPWRYEPVVTDAVSLTELPGAARRQLDHPEAIKVLVCP
jgi:threonine dehydrogenase-like Zn-dependent dehydrogenase